MRLLLGGVNLCSPFTKSSRIFMSELQYPMVSRKLKRRFRLTGFILEIKCENDFAQVLHGQYI